MTIGNPCRGMGSVTDPLCYRSICDLEQKLSISMWKSYRGSTGKKCFVFVGVLCGGFFWVLFLLVFVGGFFCGHIEVIFFWRGIYFPWFCLQSCA